MPTFTVQAASKKKDVTTKAGHPKQVVNLVLQEYGQSATVAAEWLTNPGPLPEVGSRIEGDVTPGQFGNDFKKAGGFGGGGGGGGGRSKPPEERRSIAMQHAQKCAVSLLAILGDRWEPENVNEAVKHTKMVAYLLFKQVVEAESGPAAKPSLPPAAQRSDVPNDFPPPPSGGPDALGGEQ